MRSLVLLLLFFFPGINAHAQMCTKSTIDKTSIEKKIIDTIYKADLQNQIAYFAHLNQEILPKHSTLKADILKAIKKEDYVSIQELKKAYLQNGQLLLDTAKNIQKMHYNNLNVYSILNTVLFKEVFDTFPDSYALLLNRSTLHAGNRESTLELFDAIAARYSDHMSALMGCYMELEHELKTARLDFRIVQVLQGGNDNLDTAALLHIRIMDMLLWAID